MEKEIAEWYENWHREHGVASWRSFEAYIPLVALLEAKGGETLLDVGCGTGFFLKAASEAGLETCGIDISAVAVGLSQQASPQSDVYVRSMEDLAGMGPFGYVTAFGSLEHCPDIGRALLEINKVLSPKGRFIAMVPNSKYEGPKMSIQDEIMETRKSLSEWAKMFSDAGFLITKVDHDRLMWLPTVPLNKTYQFVFTLDKND